MYRFYIIFIISYNIFFLISKLKINISLNKVQLTHFSKSTKYIVTVDSKGKKIHAQANINLL